VEVCKFSDEAAESIGYITSGENGIDHGEDGDESSEGESIPAHVGCVPEVKLSALR
jgi:hypothetical protein